MLGPFKEDQNSSGQNSFKQIWAEVYMGLLIPSLFLQLLDHNWEALASKNTLQENGGGDIDLALFKHLRWKSTSKKNTKNVPPKIRIMFPIDRHI